ncbi:hypothetical protein GR160_09650 [Flavobacterium sp. Sd200]|uniref:hypothetical protein n=1 Tax=Flavobacterium sp. Sd200 TaxID=2692211 RepID=UPI001371330E|nr:hypothetical protein [Flavobacterium sp. Sd200]MXN91492.1 hypothetical protein [Flavobacterium sp. Sd200]
MRIFYCILNILLFIHFVSAQNVNVILQVNGVTLKHGEVANLYIKFKDEIHRPNYYPGDLILDKEVFELIKTDSIGEFTLHFDYYSYKKSKQEIANFDIKLNKKLIMGPYLMIDVFDFRDKKYKHWYQYLTKEDYLVQLIYPQCGIYVRMK